MIQPVYTVHLFPELQEILLNFLHSLNAGQWKCRTAYGTWTVKDLVSHLIDGNLRGISVMRDRYLPEIRNEKLEDGLTEYLNCLNASWIEATDRLSCPVLIELLETSGNKFQQTIASLDPFEEAVFPVAWAGDEISLNWFHIAREYTEKWHHIFQILDAAKASDEIVKKLFTPKFFEPFLQTIIRALPFTFAGTNAPKGTVVELIIEQEKEYSWRIIKKENWEFSDTQSIPAAAVKMNGVTACKIFMTRRYKEQFIKETKISGDQRLGTTVLEMISVMA